MSDTEQKNDKDQSMERRERGKIKEAKHGRGHLPQIHELFFSKLAILFSFFFLFNSFFIMSHVCQKRKSVLCNNEVAPLAAESVYNDQTLNRQE